MNKIRFALISGLGAVVAAVGVGGYALTGGFNSPAAPAGAMAPSMSSSPAMMPSTSHSAKATAPMMSSSPSMGSSSMAPSPSMGPGTSPCTPSDLTVSLGVKGAAAGSTYQQVVLNNSGMGNCTLFGYPGAALTSGKSTMDQIGQAAGRNMTSNPQTVTLAPGSSASFELQVADAANYPQTMGSTQESSYLQVYIPDQPGAVYVPFMAEGTTVMSVPLLHVTPVVAGTMMP